MQCIDLNKPAFTIVSLLNHVVTLKKAVLCVTDVSVFFGPALALQHLSAAFCIEWTSLTRWSWVTTRFQDLNPIENLWHKVALEIPKRHPTNKRELIESLIAAWNRVVTHDRFCGCSR